MTRRPLLRSASTAITLFGLLLITYFAWFPFDFVADDKSFADVVGRFTWTTGPLLHVREVPANVAIFLPVGFGIAGVARSGGASRRVALLAIATIAILLSTLVEVVQSAWLLREPSVDDIVANTIGAVAGGVLLLGFERQLGRSLDWISRSADRRARRMTWLALSLVPTAIGATAVIGSRHNTQLASWDTTYPLVIGNEPTGDRPWSGEVAAVSIVDRALSDAQVSALLDGRPIADLVPGSELLHYDFTVGPALPTGLVPGGAGARQDTIISDDGLRVGPGRWIESSAPPTPLAASIAAGGELTTYLDITTSSLRQDGPARILTISAGAQTGNVTVAQDGADLIVRVRSTFAGMSGSSPEFAVPGAFDGAGRHVFVIVYDASAISVTIDEPDGERTLEQFPSTVPMVERFADDVDRLRFSRLGDLSRDAFLAATTFAPWALCIALLAGARWTSWRHLVPLAAVVIVVELAFWLMLPPPGLRMHELIMSAAVTAVAYATSALVVSTGT